MSSSILTLDWKPNMFLFAQQFPFSLIVKATRETFICFLDTCVSFQDLPFSKTPFWVIMLSILQLLLKSHRSRV